MITIDDFKKIELKVGRVLNAEPIEGSEKLLKLQVDLGEPNLPAGRQVLAGIAKHYQPSELVGRQIVIIANLEPRIFNINIKNDGPVRSKTPEASADHASDAGRTSNGMESNGMVLAASGPATAGGELVSILMPDKELPPGSSVR
ncbi:MAG: hypothetical protein A2735_00385 [Candidatus Yanofskybacteria bacterium RIFCSPHIGHO2_01_FULL_41_21]|uniref:tRNA-binding domain-containing protein n=1 Tax=Candidatus Yanofskybacteria bacterium RIFCSPHIGHO2_01_FULL_41_21 TaxID=1802660 RepID=A0A1F8EB59_9BACT|nr:MAG: hypothetical protein A2735_00385 [Candidatus Yanofskybacteria bacterium RIFCSPHIGHO2_01_FULL_41_21]